MATTTDINTLKINYLTQEQYDNATKNPNEIYITSDTSIDEIETSITTHSAQNSNYIVYARKWESGLSECYCQYKDTQSNYTSGILNGRVYRHTFSFPAGAFKETPFAVAYSGSTGNAWALSGTILLDNLTKDSITVYLVSATSDSVPVSFNVQVTGRWK